MATKPASVVHHRTHTRRVSWIDGLVEVVLTAAESDGQLGMWSFTGAAGAAAPLHVHHNEDEQFHILEGTVTFFVGEERIEAGPGDVVNLPRGVPHAYHNTSEVRAVGSCTPGGFEAFFLEAGKPPDSGDGPSIPEMAAAAQKVGVEILGPPPTL